ncbi:unnamed protein product [Colias eurytheme]|nr:unnamed protein product [Colias eurytheme]
MPPGSKLFMSQKSAYITSEIFLEWMKTHFIPRKPAGKVVLLLDGHSTHCKSVEMLEYANENDIILLSMPSHTSHYLQPLDRSVFKSLKHHFYEQCRLWLIHNPGRRISRLSFGALLSKAWGKAATSDNAIAGFKATGVYPFNPEAVPDYAFSQEPTSHSTNISAKQVFPQCTSAVDNEKEPIPGCSYEPRTDTNFSPEIVSSKSKANVKTATMSNVSDPSSKEATFSKGPDYTPTRILQEISPIPQKLTEVRKRAKQIGTLLTSEEHIQTRKNATEKILKKDNLKKDVKIKKEKAETVKSSVRSIKRKAIRRLSDTSDDIPLKLLSGKRNLDEKDNCRGCGENYYETLLVEDWLQCVVCQFWVHEHCTEFETMCSGCGEEEKRRLKTKK